MAYSGQTTHYGLPKYVSTDKPSWLDTNDAFDTIDAAIYAAATAVDPSTITTMQNDITALQSGKQDVLTFDAAPASGSVNPVTSGGVYTAVNNVSIALGVTDLKVSTLEGAISTINSDLSNCGKRTLLWTNPNVTADFTEQDIILSDSINNYDGFEVVYTYSSTVSGTAFTSGLIPKDKGTVISSNAGVYYYRTISAPSGTTLHIGGGYVSGNPNNTATIPYEVYGYKF